MTPLFRYTVRSARDGWLVIHRANKAVESQHNTRGDAVKRARDLNAVTQYTPGAVQNHINGRRRLEVGWHELRIDRAMSIYRDRGMFRMYFIVEGHVLRSTVADLVGSDFSHLMTAVSQNEAEQLVDAADDEVITDVCQHFLDRPYMLGTQPPDYKSDTSFPIILAETVLVEVKSSHHGRANFTRTSFAAPLK